MPKNNPEKSSLVRIKPFYQEVVPTQLFSVTHIWQTSGEHSGSPPFAFD